MRRALAVIDIGMTNKKIALYGTDLKLLEIHRRIFEPVISGGLETHDLAGMESWFLSVLKDAAKRFDIASIAVSTHGATFVCVDADGNPVLPCIYYTYEPGPEFHEEFYRIAGDPRKLQVTTGTPRFSALINLAKGIYYAAGRYPDDFGKAVHILNYPQYWGMRLTGVAGAEGTSMGCHTYLYDWERSTISSVAENLGIASMLPFPPRLSWETLGTLRPSLAALTGISPDAIVTMGIHDSNASLLPYLVKDSGEGFTVNSTGTWCVLMHPQEKYGFSSDEAGKLVFFNRSAYNKPVKTAIFLGGKEFEIWSGLAGDLPRSLDLEVFRKIIAERKDFIIPEIVAGSGQFPGTEPGAFEGNYFIALCDIENGTKIPSFFADPSKSLAVLDLSLVMQTLVALERTGIVKGQKIYIEGGFRHNPDYCSILAAALPDNPVLLTDMEEATAFGAALTALAALEGVTPSGLSGRFQYTENRVEPAKTLGDIESYRKEWISRIAARTKTPGGKP